MITLLKGGNSNVDILYCFNIVSFFTFYLASQKGSNKSVIKTNKTTKKLEKSKVKIKLKGHATKNKNTISSGNTGRAIDVSAELWDGNTKTEHKVNAKKTKKNKAKVQKKNDGWTVAPLQTEIACDVATNTNVIPKHKKAKLRQNKTGEKSKETKKNSERKAKKRKQNEIGM